MIEYLDVITDDMVPLVTGKYKVPVQLSTSRIDPLFPF